MHQDGLLNLNLQCVVCEVGQVVRKGAEGELWGVGGIGRVDNRLGAVREPILRKKLLPFRHFQKAVGGDVGPTQILKFWGSSGGVGGIAEHIPIVFGVVLR